MSISKIRELLELMNTNDLVELDLEEGDFKVRLKKPTAGLPPVQVHAAPATVTSTAPAAPVAAPTEDKDLVAINSPIVGTFYQSPSPDSDPFVKEGDRVKKDTVVCIVEAMKIMNEIKADISGTIVQILLENGEPVEYGQPLFMVRV